jgi:hypothetical protein
MQELAGDERRKAELVRKVLGNLGSGKRKKIPPVDVPLNKGILFI